MNQFIRKQKFQHFTGFQLATYFDTETGAELLGPRQYLEYLAENRGPSQNSLNAQASDLLLFLRYLKSCSELQVKWGSWLRVPGPYLNRILLMYPSFLAEADSCPNKFVAEVSRALSFKGLSRASAQRYLSTVNSFIFFNEEEWISQQSLVDECQIDAFASEDRLLSQLPKRNLSNYEKAALLNKSMIASVICGGPKKISRPKLSMPRRFRGTEKASKEPHEKAFPLECILDVIKGASSYRDLCLFSLLAGTGIRTSEALQLRLEDVLVGTETIKILPYSERIKVYDDLSDIQKTKLSFKGRTTKDVYFLEPFKTIFFSNLYNYIDKERDPCWTNHSFLFVTLAKNCKGRPMFLGDATAHNKTFKATQKRIFGAASHTLHALRHFYGVWLYNYAPHDLGYGYPIDVVKKAMGHASAESTKGYALPDRSIFLKAFEKTNSVLKELGYDLSAIKNITSGNG